MIPKGSITAEEYRRRVGAAPVQPRGATFSNAKRTKCRAWHMHPSKMEATVCDRLMLETIAKGGRVYRNVRFPLFSIAAKDSGLPETLTVDFVVVAADGTWRAIDAKNPTRISRDWRLRTAAFATSFPGHEVQEVDR